MAKIKQPDTHKVLAICGMHRSHTSFLTSWLSKSGLTVGDQQMRAGPGNPLGYYEDLEFHGIHENILKANQKEALDVDLGLLPIDPAMYAAAESLIKKKNAQQAQWGWKDPRTCLFFERLWQPLLDNPHVVIIYRHYNEVIDSLIRRELMFLQQSIQSYTYVDSANAFAIILNKFNKKLRISTLRYRYDYALKCNAFLKVWIIYNQHCLNLYHSSGESNSLIVNVHDVLHNNAFIKHRISHDWNFDLTFVNPKSIWDGKNPERRKFGFDRELEREAENIMEQLNNINTQSQSSYYESNNHKDLL